MLQTVAFPYRKTHTLLILSNDKLLAFVYLQTQVTLTLILDF